MEGVIPEGCSRSCTINTHKEVGIPCCIAVGFHALGGVRIPSQLWFMSIQSRLYHRI